MPQATIGMDRREVKRARPMTCLVCLIANNRIFGSDFFESF
jgi:hypothetical protein